jgi:threonine dehydratase
MPRRAAISKVDAVTAFGAEVRQEGDTVDDCVEAAKRLAVDRNLLFVHPFDDLEIVKGQAGIGLEIGRQVNDVARVVVPVGGGGLIAGVAATLRLLAPGAEVVGVQAAGCAPFRSSLRAGRPVPVANPSTIADGIAIKRPGDLTLGLVERWVDEMVAVDDDAIAEAIVLIAERAKLVVEGAGAVAVAALAAGVVAPAESGTTVALLSGGNIDPHMLAAVINRHQTGIGRRMRLFTRVSDHPGGLAGVLQTVAAAGANVLDVTHVRDGVPLRVGETGLEMLVECRGREHGEELMRTMRAAGYPADELGTEE